MMRYLCLLAALAGIAWNARLAIADWIASRHQPEASRLAMRLIPENPAYPAQLADELYAIDPVTAKSLLRRVVVLDRYDAPHWIQLGLLSEGADELPQAEAALLEAAKADVTYLPAWSLANFYFRHDNPGRFWFWARKAAQMAPDDATPLIRLAWYVSPRVDEVERQLAISRPAIALQFVQFLMSQGDADAVAQAASHLLEGDSQSLPGVCDWLIANRRAGLALPLWNSLAAQGPYTQPGAVTNGSFSRPPLSLGFDWKVPTVEGVSSFFNTNPNELGFEFSGNEPDGFVLLSQTIAVEAQKNYVLTTAYSAEGIASGVSWQVTDERSGAVLTRTSSLATACFAAPAGASFVNLSLGYQRQPGTVRVEGKLTLDAVRLSQTSCQG